MEASSPARTGDAESSGVAEQALAAGSRDVVESRSVGTLLCTEGTAT